MTQNKSKQMTRTETSGIPKSSRRGVLKRTGTAALGACAAPMIVPSTIFGANAPSNRITMGCIGTGNQGTRDMNGFLHNDDLQILAVCDVNRGSSNYKTESQFRGREPAKKIVEDYYAKNSRSGIYSGCDAYGDFRQVIERDDIDAVLIVTPDHWHAIPTIMAARAGKDVYCEKPLSLTVREGRAMVEAVRSNGVVFQTGSHHRSKARMRFACELVQNGRIGKVKRFTTVLGPHPLRRDIMDWKPMPVPEGFDYDFWLGPAPLAPYHDARCLYNFRFIMDYAGGETTNTGAHAFDIVQWANGTQLTGPVEFEDLGSEFPTKGLYTAVSKIHFRAQYANGVELLCLPSGGFKNMTARVEGEEGSIDISWDGIETQPVALQRSVIGPDDIHLYESKDHYRNFLDCVKSRLDPIAPVEVGHRSASLCHLANIAMFLKTKLKWDPIAERVTNNEEANLLLGRDMRSPWSL